jgi:uncharacterized protein (TIGR03790 family)
MFKNKTLLLILNLTLLLGLFKPPALWALRSDEVLVLANRNVEKSVALARYYMTRRAIPKANLLVLNTTTSESIKRDGYDNQIAAPLNKHIQSHLGPQIRCVVLMYGLPLKIDSKDLLIKEKIGPLKRKLNHLQNENVPKTKALKKDIAVLKRKITQLRLRTQKAAVDSELAFARVGTYALAGWVPNPYFVGFKGRKFIIDRKDVLMVSRLDGPSPESVIRIINDSIWAEKNGLKGTAYLDARWPPSKKGKPSGYAAYDNSLHKTARLLRKNKVMPVVINSAPHLFGPGQAPEAALYCGWYSLAKYVDAFSWRRGAVGYHIASAECRTLKKPESTVWCKKMIEKGVAATIGPVNEPYIQAFPLPEIFFALLTNGYLSLAECYLASIPFFSWQMVLIGDPLYRPFQTRRNSTNIFPAELTKP